MNKFSDLSRRKIIDEMTSSDLVTVQNAIAFLHGFMPGLFGALILTYDGIVKMDNALEKALLKPREEDYEIHGK